MVENEMCVILRSLMLASQGSVVDGPAYRRCGRP
jgi:hypothetical protein